VFWLVLAAAPLAAGQEAAGSKNDESLSRIRQALARDTKRLQIVPPTPTFKVEITQHPFFTERPETWNFAGGGVPPGTRADHAVPAASVDVWPMLRGLREKIAERRAQEEVSASIAAFCATHECD